MFVRAEIPYVHIVHPVSAFAELAAKFALNAISTYAHVCIGKVYKNRMVDLAVSNTKLFHRSIAIVGELMAVSEVSIDSVLPSHSAIFPTHRGSPVRSLQISFAGRGDDMHPEIYLRGG